MTTSDKGKLDELIFNGKELMTQIQAAKDKLQTSLAVYIIGHHNAVSADQIKSNFLVSTKGTEDFSIYKRPISEEDFRESIRNIAHVPSVIVHIENVEDGIPQEVLYNLSRIARKPVFRVPDKIPHKPGCTTREYGWRLVISCVGSRVNALKFHM